MANLEYQWLSALLCYPEAELIAALPEFQVALASIPALKKQRDPLQLFLNEMGSHDLIELQDRYVATFDRNRSHALYIFEHVHGEDRDRGSAMVDLLQEYHSNGFQLGDDELPDYLPVLLEYLANVDQKKAKKLLGDAVHVVEHIRIKLEKNCSPYAALLATLVTLSPVTPKPLVEAPVRDMDEAMETFGSDIAGVEPLLKPSIETIQFYPKADFQTAAKGVEA